jgi:hypothetical protein
LLSEQSNKDPSLSWRRTGRFSAQNGKDEPNSRITRAWQKNDKETNIKKKKIEYVLIDRLTGGFQSAVCPDYIGSLVFGKYNRTRKVSLICKINKIS